MVRACIALLAGLYALQLSSFLLAVCVIGIASLILAVMRRWRLLFCFAAGVLLFYGSTLALVDDRIAHAFAGDSMLTTVRVIDFPRLRNDSVRLLVTAPDDARIPARVLLSWYKPSPRPVIGDVWQLEVRLRRPRGNSNPGVFDYESWLFRERITATGYVVPGPRNQRLHSGETAAVNRVRARIIEKIETAVGNPQTAAVLIALVSGSRHQLSAEQWQRYALTGTSHLMAISGLHVGLAALAAYFAASLLQGLLGFRGNNHDRALLWSVAAALAYVLVSGLAVPAQRAWIMLLLGATVLLRRRRIAVATVVAVSCVCVVLADPVTTLSPGFKLSFAAVAVLLWTGQRYAGPTRHDRWLALHSLLRRLRQLISMQLLLLLGLTPFTALIFQRIALYAPPVNLLAVPVFSTVTVPAALAGISVGADSLLRLAALSIGWLEWLITQVAALPGADSGIRQLTGAALALAILPLLWAVLPPGWPGRGVAWLGLLALLCWKPAPPPFACLDATVFDVGQGLAVSLRTRSYAALYDTGPAWRSGSSAAERIVIPSLRASGITHIETLILSDDDPDHAGGAEAVREALHPQQLYAAGTAAATHIPRLRCRRGQHWHRDGIEFRFLLPQSGAEQTDRHAVCVLQITVGRYRLLLPGDIAAMAERQLQHSGLVASSTVVVVPQHGSRKSSSSEFIAAVSPELAIVSSGYSNRRGYPHADVLARWRQQGSAVLNTANAGAVSLRLCQRGGLRWLQSHRMKERRLWHEP